MKSETTSKLSDDEKRRSYPRGHFTEVDKWSKDKATRYFKGFRFKVGWPLLKTLILSTIAFISRWHYAHTWLTTIAICLVVLLSFQRTIAWIFGYVPMSAIDQVCFCSNRFSLCNFMNVTTFDSDILDGKKAK